MLSFTASVSTNQTNSTILFGLSASSPETSAYTNLTWGLNTSYQWSAETNAFAGTLPTGGITVFLNFLEPSTTYYYRVTGWMTCKADGETYLYRGSLTGSWETQGPDIGGLYTGLVKDANGTRAPADVPVAAGCYGVNATPDGPYAPGYTVTNANGTYSVPWNAYYGNGWQCQTHTYVQVGPWAGHWNETILTWGAQVVNFVVPIDQLSGFMPTVVDFSNAGANYTQLALSQGTGYENSYTYAWTVSGTVGGDVSFGGSASGSDTSTTGYTTQLTEGVDEGSFCWASRFMITGDVGFSAVTRGWSDSISLFDPSDGNFCADVGVQTPADWVPNGTDAAVDSYYLPGPAGGAYAGGLEEVGLTGGQFLQYSFTVSSEVTTSTGVSLTFGLSASLAGVVSLDYQQSVSWSQSVTTTSTTTLSFTIRGLGTGASCYNVVGQGGVASEDTADLVSIVFWAGHLSNGIPIC